MAVQTNPDFKARVLEKKRLGEILRIVKRFANSVAVVLKGGREATIVNTLGLEKEEQAH